MRLPMFLLLCLLAAPAAADVPNILWITCEDTGPHLGCYGDPDADTPHLDALAARGVLYERAWSNAPVCAPARTTILTGRYPFRLGAAPMRTEVSLPAGMQVLPELMRAAGYYCTNRSKTDYNVQLGRQVWDESSGKAHWRGRAEGQPFFSVVNLTTPHEGQIRKRPHEAVHDPATIHLPAYHPDHPTVRQDWAQYHDKVTEMDAQVGSWLGQLAEDGLVEDTIVFFFGDHGPGMPRSKRWPYASGLRVPFLLHVPERFRHLAPQFEAGLHTDEKIGFVDLLPTVLALAGAGAPGDLDGRAFLGAEPDPEPAYLLGFRDRMDERVDLVRSLCDGPLLYIRNYHPHRRYGEFVDYMFQTPTTRVWERLYEEGALEPQQASFWGTKPAEELYDLRSDPDEVHNLAGNPGHAQDVERLRVALHERLVALDDRSFLPEDDLLRRAGAGSPANVAAPIAAILSAAEAASDPRLELPATDRTHADPAVRAWAATGLLIRGAGAVRAEAEWLRARLADTSPSVRIQAAEALGMYGGLEDRERASQVLLEHANLEHHDVRTAVAALNAIDALEHRVWPHRDAIAALPRQADHVPGRMQSYVPRLVERIEQELGPRRVVYREVGELELELFLFEPPGPSPAGGRPAVVFFHGGGWNSGDPNQFFDQAAELVDRGVVVASARYRLGKDGHLPTDAVADAIAAVRWVRAQAAELGVDPQRIAAGGGSAGGHLAAATAFVDAYDPDPEGEVSARPDLLLLYNPVIDNGPGGWGHAKVEGYWASISPLHNVAAPAPPTLFLLGTKDALVPVSTAEAFAAAVRAAGGRCDLELHEGAGHGWFNRGRGGYAATTRQLVAFLRSVGWIA